MEISAFEVVAPVSSTYITVLAVETVIQLHLQSYYVWIKLIRQFRGNVFHELLYFMAIVQNALGNPPAGIEREETSLQKKLIRDLVKSSLNCLLWIPEKVETHSN